MLSKEKHNSWLALALLFLMAAWATCHLWLPLMSIKAGTGRVHLPLHINTEMNERIKQVRYIPLWNKVEIPANIDRHNLHGMLEISESQWRDAILQGRLWVAEIGINDSEVFGMHYSITGPSCILLEVQYDIDCFHFELVEIQLPVDQSATTVCLSTDDLDCYN